MFRNCGHFKNVICESKCIKSNKMSFPLYLRHCGRSVHFRNSVGILSPQTVFPQLPFKQFLNRASNPPRPLHFSVQTDHEVHSLRRAKERKKLLRSKRPFFTHSKSLSRQFLYQFLNNFLTFFEECLLCGLLVVLNCYNGPIFIPVSIFAVVS